MNVLKVTVATLRTVVIVGGIGMPVLAASVKTLSPAAVLKNICLNDPAYARRWIDPQRGVTAIYKDGSAELFPKFEIVESSTFFSFIEGRHTIECPRAFAENETVCRKSAGGEAYHYFFQNHRGRPVLTRVEVDYEE